MSGELTECCGFGGLMAESNQQLGGKVAAAVVDEILNQSRSLTHYEMDFGDDWQTPGSFIRSGFRGDCEDIAIFMMGTLKRLNYPYKVRVLVIEDLFADHAQLKVQMPDGCWRWYESTRRGSYSSCPHGWRPVVEFDENAIVYYAPAGSNRIASSP